MRQEDWELWQEYEKMFASWEETTPEILRENLDKDRQRRAEKKRHQGRHRVDDVEKAELELAKRAEAACLSRAGWQALDASEKRGLLCEVWMIHKDASEMLEYYQEKLSTAHNAKKNALKGQDWYEKRQETLKANIALLPSNGRRRLKKANNKLAWARQKAMLDCEFALSKHQRKIEFCESKIIKWLGIVEKIKLAEITKQLQAEKDGRVAPRYGYGISRGESEFIHEDN